MFFTQGNSGNSTRTSILLHGLLFVLPVLLYLPAVQFDFVWDDYYFVVKNQALRKWGDIPRYFVDANTYSQDFYAPMYRPLRNISFLIDYKVAGLGAWFYHLHNIVLHGINTFLVYLLIKRVTGGRASRRWDGYSAVGALLWAFHPVNTEAVAWVKSRDEVLFLLFFLVALVAAWPAAGPGRVKMGRGAVTFGAVVLSLLTKEMAVSFPLVLLAAHLMLGEKVRSGRSVLLVAVSGVAVIGYVAARHLVLGQSAQVNEPLAGSWSAQLLTMFAVFGKYAFLIVAPTRLVADYQGYPLAVTLTDPRVWGGIVVLVIVFAVIIATWRRQPVIAFGFAWYLLTLAPVSNIIPTMQFLAERFLYLPLIGIVIVAVSCLRRFVEGDLVRSGEQSIGRRRAVYLILGLVVLTECLVTSVRLPDWKNSLTLHERTFKDAPASDRITLNYVTSVLANERRIHEALPLLSQLSQSTAPARLRASTFLVEQAYGLVLLQAGYLDEGLTHSLTAVRLNPRYPDSYSNLGMYHGMRGNHAEAFEQFRKAHDLAPEVANYKRNMVLALIATGRLDEAESLIMELTGRNPRGGDVQTTEARASELRALIQ